MVIRCECILSYEISSNKLNVSLSVIQMFYVSESSEMTIQMLVWGSHLISTFFFNLIYFISHSLFHSKSIPPIILPPISLSPLSRWGPLWVYPHLGTSSLERLGKSPPNEARQGSPLG